MMPSTSLQSRISAFEVLGGPSTLPSASSRGNSSKPSINLLDSPISPSASSFFPIQPYTPPKASSRSPSPSPPNLGRKTSLIDLKDWVVDDGPARPSSGSEQGHGHVNGNGSGSAGRYKEYHRTPRSVPSKASIRNNSTPLINFESPPKPTSDKAPPLPPRKPSYSSLKSASSSNSVSSRTHSGSGSGSTLHPPSRSDSLTVDHTYPPLSKLNINGDSRRGPSHAAGSSISSFHSVSLSSDGGTTDGGTPNSVTNFVATFPMDRHNSGDVDSLDDSFENVSTSSAISPSSNVFDWDQAMAQRKTAPPLPQRPGSKPPSITSPGSSSPIPRSIPTSPRLQASHSSSSSSSSTTTRRAPPPPPLSNAPPSFRSNVNGEGSRPSSSRASLTSISASDRSSILSTTSRTSVSTRASRQQPLLRPTPVPAMAKKRYEGVFVANILQQRQAENARKATALLSPGTRKSRQAAGWRGLSVDLITNPDDNPLKSLEKEGDGGIEPIDEKLDGRAVKLIWSASRLEKEKLKKIWDECDSAGEGCLDRESFAKGMWRIDEELRRAQLTRHTPTSSSPFRVRLPPKPAKLILR
ncbi:hypothetical protein PLICRDRAFT_91601 [Plicaturopsis crispa FD-325 SS-3]|nr:hypothetical protein PLICRDRAFT_91601 [Plicaturopsis crispa FD-325 SS-3]